ncbi:MAG TPA: hypothetical protein VHE61_12320 [Opitutaceae bacterium]|nr:hypothetical protein [Opitutaceae bacterium]
MIARSLSASAVAVSLLCAGCHKASIHSYRIPKETDPQFSPAAAASTDAGGSGAGGGMAGTAVPTEHGADLTWTAPKGWTAKPPTPMRKGSFEAPGGVDFSITAFPGDVGGELANVNRWRGQVGLSDVADSDLPQVVAEAEHNGLKFSIVDFAGSGADAKRIVGAIVPYAGATWFFKLIGPQAAVENDKPAFIDFLQTVQPPAGAGAPQSQTASSPAAASPDMASTAVPVAQGAGLAWTAPGSWEAQPLSPMRKGSYRVGGASGATADMSITAFPGDVGGELANVNRWRGQVQLPPISDADLPNHVTRADHDGLRITVVDVSGSGADAPRILGALVPYHGATWFFKLSGPASVVGQAKPAFLSFLQSVKPATSAQ